MADKGYFIALEGVEGAGKSTHLQLMQEFLAKHIRKPIITSREPGGTEIAEKIRRILLQHHAEQMFMDTELLLMFASRAQHLAAIIKPALEQGAWVLCDRFTDASYAYQGYGRGMNLERIALLEQWVQGQLRPDKVLIFDLPVEIALQRIQSRKQMDRIEQEELDFFQRVRQGYLQLAKRDPSRYKIIDTIGTVEQVQERWQPLLQDLLHAD